MKRCKGVVALFCVVVLVCSGSAGADCHQRPGERGALYGTSDDPNVLVWGSRFRLRLYEEGTWDQAHTLVSEALLAPPGTRAVVVSCISDFVHSKYGGEPEDAIGIKIVTGPLRGRTGWVLSSALHVISSAMRRKGLLLARGKNAHAARSMDGFHRDAIRVVHESALEYLGRRSER